MNQALRVAFVMSVLVMLLSCSSKPDYSPNPTFHTTRFPQTRTMSEAKVWLHWNASERIAFVRGFVIGYDKGCRTATDASDSQSICREQTKRLPPPFSALVFDDKVGEYSKSMTAFYEAYPEDDDVPITFLLESLALDQETPVQVHNLLPPRSH
jgi:hypothetical protein